MTHFPVFMKCKLLKHESFLVCISLFILAISVHSGSLRSDFVDWDDPAYVMENSRIQNLTWKNLAALFNPLERVNKPFAEYHPLRDFSLAIDFAIWKFRPFGFHLTNVLFHGLNCSLLYLFLFHLFSNRPAAVFGSLLFAVHPVHVESVAWIASRKDVLAIFFILLSGLSYLTGHRLRSTALALFLFTLGLLCKSQSVTFPVLFAVRALWLKRGTERRRELIRLIPFFLVSGIFISLFLYLQFTAKSLSALYGQGFEPHPVAILQSFARYVGLVLFPFSLSPYYDITAEIKKIDLAFAASLTWFIVYIAIIARQWKTRGLVGLSLLLFGLQLLPVLNLIPHPIWLADRYLYFAAPFFYWPIAFGTIRVGSRAPRRAAILSAIGLATLSLLTWQQTHIWKNSETLWRTVWSRYPDAFPANLNLAAVLRETNRPAEAKVFADKALTIEPGDPKALGNAITVRLLLHEYADADRLLRVAKNRNPDSHDWYLLAGDSYYFQGDYSSALREYSEAARLAPNVTLIYLNAGKALVALNRLKDAEDFYEECLRINPMEYRCRHALGNLSAKHLGDFERAEKEFASALNIKPDYGPALYDLGILFVKRGDLKMGRSHLERALAADPYNAETQRALKAVRRP
ncbi:MAG TPA: tetratricopeptide repeat protein [Bdellovibrionota bacterium]|nr:tetratricopeptide repeat protein [Bdellovibrionota bacterium]